MKRTTTRSFLTLCLVALSCSESPALEPLFGSRKSADTASSAKQATSESPSVWHRLFSRTTETDDKAADVPSQPRFSISWNSYFKDAKLVALIDTAIANNNDLKIALTRIDAAKARFNAARGALLPTVSGSAAATRSRSGKIIASDFSNTGTDLTLGLETSWELDLWGKLRSAKSAALSRLLATSEARRLVQTNLVSDLATAYYELLALDAQLIILNDTYKLQEDAFTTVKAQKEAGAANELALQQFEAQLKSIEGQKLDAQQQIIENEGIINLLIGRQQQPIARSKSPLLEASLPSLASRTPSQYLANRPDIRAAELELAATKADVKAAKAAFYPTLTLDGSIGLQAFKVANLLDARSTAASIIGGLVAPLINRSAIKAQFAQANAAQLEAMYAYQQALVNGYVEVHNQLATNRLLDKTYELKTQEIALLTKSVATSSDLFRTSRATYLEVLTAQRSALEARLQQADVKKRKLQTSVKLYKALGGG